MDWDDLRVFLQAARCHSMTDAARQLGLSVPTIARRLDTLEHATGLRLVKRTPRGLILTEAGAQFAEQARGLEREAAALQRLAIGLRGAAGKEVVRVSATEPVIAEILAPRLALLLGMESPPRIELRVENEIATIALSDIDVAVRLVRPEAEGLVTRRIATLSFGLFGSESYIGSLGGAEPGLPVRARILSYDQRYGPIPERQWLEAAGIADQVVARMSSTRGLVAAAAAGAGLAILPHILALPAGLRQVPATPGPQLPQRDVWLVWHKAVARRGPTRKVLKWIAASFKSAGT